MYENEREAIRCCVGKNNCLNVKCLCNNSNILAIFNFALKSFCNTIGLRGQKA